ncbi:MAG: transglutaminaseTgpA domain-containing protein [Planctomycetota bacterium]
MTLDRAVRRLVFWQVMLGVFTFCLIEPNPGLLLVAGSLAALSRYATEGPRARTLPRLVVNLGALGALTLLGVELSAKPERVVEAMGHFLIWLQVLTLFGRRGEREHIQLMVLSALQMTGASVLPRGGQVLFAVLLALYAAVALGAVLAHHLQSGRDRARRRQRALAPAGLEARALVDAAPEGTLPRRAWVWAGVLALTCGAIGAATFVAAPRGVKGRLAHVLAEHTPFGVRAQVGFSDAVQLDGSPVNNGSSQVALLLEADDRPPGGGDAWLLRASVFDRYDPATQAWRRIDRLSGFELGSSRARRTGLKLPAAEAEPAVRATITLRTHPPPSLPTLTWIGAQTLVSSVDADRIPVRLSPEAGLLTAAARGRGEVRYTLARPDQRIALNASSATPDGEAVVAEPAVTDDPTPPDWGIDPALDWPVQTERVEALARAILADAHIDWPDSGGPTAPGDSSALHTLDPVQVERAARAISDWLESRYAYTLENPAVRGRDAVAVFLFDQQRGHCELFASGFTALCRSIGVPSRLVTGYRAGEINRVGGYFTVRERHAHAWAEVDLGPELGWVAFDPTPAGAVDAEHAADLPWWLAIRQAYEHLELVWVRDVIGFDAEARAGLVGAATRFVGADGPPARAGLRLWRTLGRAGRPAWFEVAAMGFVVFATAATTAILVMLGVSRRRKLARLRILELPRPERKRLARDLAFYLRMVDMLRRHGYDRPAWQSPSDFAAELTREHPQGFDAVGRLTDAFYAVRFGGLKSSTEDRQAQRADLRQLESDLILADRA